LPPPAERPPPIDELTTLDGIIAHMLPKDNKDLPFYQKELQDMDRKFQVHQHLVEEYNKHTFLPYVHAELILLEHFYRQKYDFVDGDKHIGCSKPACYCCYHYICEHPGNFVCPASHNKIYLNWNPLDVINDADGSTVMHQRDIMNRVGMVRFGSVQFFKGFWRPQNQTIGLVHRL
jgi:OTT_1508-like deaminase